MPGWKEAAAGLIEYSQCRVRSPLVELTAWHKKCLRVGYWTDTPYSDSVTDV